jgi:hypothetical protein
MDYLLFGFLIVVIILLIISLPHIIFVSANEATKVFRRNFLCRLMNYKCPDIFVDFTSDEKAKIEHLYKKSKIDIKLKLIKIIDPRGWPFTIEDYIILPDKLIKNFTQETFNELIIHELIHVKQRKNQAKLNKFYAAIGFIRIPEFRIKTKSQVMFNPDDEPGVKWVYPITDMTVVMPAMVGSAQKIIFLRVNDNTGFYEETDIWDFDKSPYSDLIIKKWKQHLPTVDLSPKNNNRYSPNEVLSGLSMREFDDILGSLKLI